MLLKQVVPKVGRLAVGTTTKTRPMSLAASSHLPLVRFGVLSPFSPEVAIPSLHQRLQQAVEQGKEAISELWNGILNAAPKKKTSHQKKRQRQLAPGSKQLKPLNNLNRCPSCGHYKRSHTLCMHCVNEIKRYWNKKDKEGLEVYQDPLDVDAGEKIKVGDSEEDVNSVSRRLVYPKKVKVLSSLNHQERETYVPRYPRTLPVEKEEK